MMPCASAPPPIPDRVSVLDPPHLRFPLWDKLVVAVDGVDVPMVISFCVSEGWVNHHAFDLRGRLILDESGDALAVYRAMGKVEPRYSEFSR